VVLRVLATGEATKERPASGMSDWAEGSSAADPPPAGTEDGSGDLPLKGGGEKSVFTSPLEGEVAELCSAGGGALHPPQEAKRDSPSDDAGSPQDEEPPPGAEPPAARDGFPEPTDTRD
jgi:hypothetical protein